MLKTPAAPHRRRAALAPPWAAFRLRQMRPDATHAPLSQYSSMPNREALTLLVQRKDNPTDQIYVFWPSDPKIGVKPIQRCARAVPADGFTSIS